MSSLLTYDSLLYLAPGRKEKIEFDFVDEIPAGDSIKAVGAGTAVTAVSSEGTPFPSIISQVVIDGTKLRATISNITEGRDYLVTYTIQAEISGEQFDKYLVVRARTRGLYL